MPHSFPLTPSLLYDPARSLQLIPLLLRRPACSVLVDPKPSFVGEDAQDGLLDSLGHVGRRPARGRRFEHGEWEERGEKRTRKRKGSHRARSSPRFVQQIRVSDAERRSCRPARATGELVEKSGERGEKTNLIPTRRDTQREVARRNHLLPLLLEVEVLLLLPTAEKEEVLCEGIATSVSNEAKTERANAPFAPTR
jgi:hypothetical protein